MEFFDNPTVLESGIAEASLLYRITTRIRRSLDLQEILTATVAEVRAFLGTDRVMMYRFDSDGSGEVIAESIDQQRLPSLLGLHFPADDIPPEHREMFLWARQRSIVNVASGRIGLWPLESSATGNSLKIENLYYRAVDPCHIQYLTAMGVQSSLAVPIVHQDPIEESNKPRLWGLLVSHHSTPRPDMKREVQVVQQVVDQVSIAIAQSYLLTQTRAEQQRQAIVNRVTTLLHSLPTIQLQPALEATIAAFDGVGGRLYIEQSAELYTWGEQPTLANDLENTIIEQHLLWQDWLAECKQGNIWAITDLYKEPHWEVLAPLFPSTRIRGMLIIPLNFRQQFIGVFSIFRTGFDTEILWAGQRDPHERQRLPQLSFTAWLEQKKQQAPEWKPEEISMGRALAEQFAIAIQQQQMYQQMQVLNTKLEGMSRERAELQQSLDLNKVIKQVSDQIRSNLDYKITLQTIVQEVRKLLKTDRVLIYQILDDLRGEVIVEDVDAQFGSILGMITPLECFPDEYAHLYLRGRVRAINNTTSPDLSLCHRQFLQTLQIQANLIVPIKMGTQLWGLIIAHECRATRNWQDAEIDLLQRLADEAVLAIQQAQLYETSRAAESLATGQAEQLTQALNEIQQAQIQLIKTEKMSSLGLWALGVAQEIKNPVNFIYCNLSYTNDYTKELLELLRLYQLHYPYPNIEIRRQAEAIDLDFLTENLPQILLAMKAQAERINSMMFSLRNFSGLDRAAIKSVDQHEAQ
ncbi:GAF domain-containing protein [Calothrix sp. PCC 7507]|uniref:GAF domain-containing protein n=1 Tax=Calothrix sp. PCC 7507 TaxID=99598 RepID=UPI00029EEEDD|nr:putative phytochrome sensor protein [Calothrix sp. PCC 7507]